MEKSLGIPRVRLNAINEQKSYDNPTLVSDGDVELSRKDGGSETTQPNKNGDSGSSVNNNGDTVIPNGTETDLNVRDIIEIIRTLDVNSYATRKTIAQGMLDLALLAANASQLKFLLTAGAEHEFYGLLLTLIIISLLLQAVQAVICVILGMVLNINKVDEQRSAEIINNICVAINVLTVIVNVVISAFDMRVVDDLRSGSTTN